MALRQGRSDPSARDVAPQDASSEADETVQTPEPESTIATTADEESTWGPKTTTSKKKGKKGK